LEFRKGWPEAGALRLRGFRGSASLAAEARRANHEGKGGETTGRRQPVNELLAGRIRAFRGITTARLARQVILD